MLWKLEDLITRTKKTVSHSDQLTDQAFAGPSDDADQNFRNAINEAYNDEVEDAKQIGDPRWFIARYQFNWQASSPTLTLPAPLQGAQIVRLADITDGYPGQVMWMGDVPQFAQFHWRDRTTLQWGQTGPGSTRTLEAAYHAAAEWMKDPADEPALIPNQFRHLLVWSAACLLLQIRDIEAPGQWLMRRDEIRMRWHKYLSMGRPTETGFPGIRNTDPDYGPYP
jgi:hypothetical protein